MSIKNIIFWGIAIGLLLIMIDPLGII